MRKNYLKLAGFGLIGVLTLGALFSSLNYQAKASTLEDGFNNSGNSQEESNPPPWVRDNLPFNQSPNTNNGQFKGWDHLKNKFNQRDKKRHPKINKTVNKIDNGIEIKISSEDQALIEKLHQNLEGVGTITETITITDDGFVITRTGQNPETIDYIQKLNKQKNFNKQPNGPPNQLPDDSEEL